MRARGCLCRRAIIIIIIISIIIIIIIFIIIIDRGDTYNETQLVAPSDI